MKIKNKILTTTFSLITILGLSLVNTNKIENRKIDNRINIQNLSVSKPSISLGGAHSGAITSNNDVFIWGNNNNGQLGDETNIGKNIPLNITSNFNGLESNEHIIQLSMGTYHSSALTNKGNVFMWGDNEFGQLGNGTNANKKIPTNITEKFGLTPGDTIIQIYLGAQHSSALTNKGNVFTWGQNKMNQLGDGTNTHKNIPTNITEKFNLTENEHIIQLSMGSNNSSALTDKGNVFMWGSNSDGQLGNGTIGTNKNIPTNITEKFNLNEDEQITQLGIGENHSSALTNKGKVFMWGDNYTGQLGNETTDEKHTPLNITEKFELTENEQIIQLGMGSNHSSALTDKGKVFMWGDNNNGRLGDGTEDEKHTPLNITSNFNGLESNEHIIQLGMGSNHSSALTNKGNVFMWGNNAWGQLGIGETVNWIRPININLISIIDGNSVKAVPKEDTPTSITINFNIDKNHQNGNVIVRDKDNNEKGSKYGASGTSSITIDNLTSNTTYNNWTIEVDGNGQISIPEFTTTKRKSAVSNVDVQNIKHDYIEIYFIVAKNDQLGNVVVRDEKNNEIGRKNNADSTGIIPIQNLKSNTTYKNWTIEVDGNDKTIIPEFTTAKQTSILTNIKPKNMKHTSVDIHFTLTKKDQNGDITIRDNTNTIVHQVAGRNIMDGYNVTTIDKLNSNTTYTGWTIDADGNDKTIIPEFTTAKQTSTVGSVIVQNIKHDYIEIYFIVAKNDQKGNVVIKDENGKVKGIKDNVDGIDSIVIGNLESDTIYNGWTIEVDGNDKTTIKEFVTSTIPPISSENTGTSILLIIVLVLILLIILLIIIRLLISKPNTNTQPVKKKPVVKKPVKKKPVVNKKQQELLKKQLLKKQLLKTNQQLLKELNNEKIQ